MWRPAGPTYAYGSRAGLGSAAQMVLHSSSQYGQRGVDQYDKSQQDSDGRWCQLVTKTALGSAGPLRYDYGQGGEPLGERRRRITIAPGQKTCRRSDEHQRSSFPHGPGDGEHHTRENAR